MTTLFFLGGIAALFLLFIIYDYKTEFMKLGFLDGLANKRDTSVHENLEVKFEDSDNWLDKTDMRSPSYEWPSDHK